jgi:hypothetical protein
LAQQDAKSKQAAARQACGQDCTEYTPSLLQAQRQNIFISSHLLWVPRISI